MSTQGKAVLYARVSTKEQAEEGYSIEAQIKLLREYAHDKGFEIVREFTDAESAKSAGRTQFGDMQRFLKQATTVKTILCEKTDRLYRNFHDYIALDIDQSDVTVIFVKEGTILNKDSRSHEKLVHGLKVLLAKNYIDNLKEETAKGMLEKAEQGEFPQLAPIGYRNNKETHRIDVDRERAPLIRRMFELYATGNYSLQSLQCKITEEGLRSKGGRKLQKSEVAYVLNSPIYYGDFRWRGKIYKGIHEPIITKGLFQAAQAVMKRYNVVRTTKMDFAFRGLLTCGKCNTAFTAERKKGKYVYYHCSFSKTRCKNGYFREEILDERLSAIIKGIQIDSDTLNLLTDGLKESHAQEKVYHEQAIASLNQTYQKLQEKLDRAYNDKLDGVITEEFWAARSQSWRKEQEEIRDSIGKHEAANQSYFDMGLQLLTLANRAYDLYRVRSLPEKRQLLNFVVSNLRVEGETLYPVYKKPFDLLAKGCDRPNWLPASNGHRTDLKHLNPLLDPRIALAGFSCLWDESIFDQVNGAKGAIRILFPPEAQAVRARQRRYKPPRPPPIQRLLQRAYELKQQLDATPDLTRFALAKNLRLDPSRITQILNLLNLAPRIQAYIRGLRPTKHHDPIGDAEWMRLARIHDHRSQVQNFNRVLGEATTGVSHSQIAISVP